MEAAFPLLVADECSRVSGQELSEADEVAHADLVRGTKGKELDAWESFRVFKSPKAENVGKTAADTRCVSR